MSYHYGIPSQLLQFLGACVYSDAKSFYADLSDAGRAELEAQGNSFGMAAWFYRYLHDVLPEEKKAAYRKIYQMRQMKAMICEQELKRLYHVLAGHGLRFVPIKGADLAYRLYPDTALRVFNDWDIWFHPDDCERAIAVLAEDGWKVLERYSDDHEAVRKIAGHHYSPHRRGNNVLEPHFSLSNFENVDLNEMWKHTLEYPQGDGQRVLSPEMNLLMLGRHAATRSYYHAQIPKLAVDAAMVMRKEKVDFTALRELAARWHLPYPGDLLAAFPEFFPAETIDAFGADPAKTNVFRKIFETRDLLGETENTSLLLSRFETNGMVARGILNRIRTHNAFMMRCMYRLPKEGAWGRLLWAYVSWFWTRTWMAAGWIRRDRRLKKYGCLVESVDSGSCLPR